MIDEQREARSLCWRAKQYPDNSDQQMYIKLRLLPKILALGKSTRTGCANQTTSTVVNAAQYRQGLVCWNAFHS